MDKIMNQELWNEWNGGTQGQDLYVECIVGYVKWLEKKLLEARNSPQGEVCDSAELAEFNNLCQEKMGGANSLPDGKTTDQSISLLCSKCNSSRVDKLLPKARCRNCGHTWFR